MLALIRRPFLLLLTASLLPAQSPTAAPRPLQVTGRVVTSDGRPIAGARLAFGAPDTLLTADVLNSPSVSADDGTFTLSCPPAPKNQHWDLVIAAKGFAAAERALPTEVPSASAPRQVALGDLHLVPGQRLVGRVRDAAGQPVGGALVTAHDLLRELQQANYSEYYACRARTNASGIFDLPAALPVAMRIDVQADGYYRERRQPVAAGTPLEFELAPSGWIAGQVRTAAGAGCADASVLVVYEASSHEQELRVDADGRWRAPLLYPGRWRAHASTDEPYRHAASPLGSGPAVDVMIQFEPDAPTEPGGSLRVRATVAGKAEGVRTLRAAAIWGDIVRDAGPWLPQLLAGQLARAKPGTDGSVEVSAPGEAGVAGAVMVAADGHAPTVKADLTWDPTNPSVTVELQPEAVVLGVVRDATNQAPLADAEITIRPANGDVDPFGIGLHEVVPAQHSGADGTFRLGQLPAGEWRITVRVDGRPAPRPQTVTTQAGATLRDVVFDVPRGVRLDGKLVGAPIGGGLRVSLSPMSLDTPGFVFAQQADRFTAVPVAADGTFVFPGLAPGHYTLLMQVPAPPRSGGALSLPIDSFRVRGDDMRREFDVAADRVHAIRGRLSFPAVSPPCENLLVVAVPQSADSWQFQGVGSTAGLRAFVGRDGSFELPVVPGEYRVLVFDLGLGSAIALGKTVSVETGDVTCDLGVALSEVTIALVAQPGQTMAPLERLEVRSSIDNVAAGRGVAFLEDYELGFGVPLPRGATSLTLALPHGEVLLAARSNVARLRSADEGDAQPALGTLQLTVSGQRNQRAELEIAPPPAVAEPAAGDGR